MEIKLDYILRAAKLDNVQVYNVYIFGSQVYGTQSSGSDYDIIIIADVKLKSTEIRRGFLNIHLYNLEKFTEDLENHRINNLECIFAPQWAILKEDIKFKDFKINLNKLRHSISKTSSNSWVKSKKKLIVEREHILAIKSIFHSIRILMFGIQIAKTGRIYDFKCANEIWGRLRRHRWKWNELDSEFRELYNDLCSEFRIVAPKN